MPEDILPFFPSQDEQEVYEAIDPEEVDRAVSVLRKLIRQISSPTIRDLLQATRQDIACLVDDSDELLDSESGSPQQREAA
jgi:hypothetical protein